MKKYNVITIDNLSVCPASVSHIVTAESKKKAKEMVVGNSWRLKVVAVIEVKEK